MFAGGMPVFESYPQGTPCFVELVTPDLSSAAEFYSALFGWELGQRSESETESYRVATLGGHVVAGLDGDMPPMAGHPAFWKVYLAVDDIEAATGLVPVLGGVVESGPTRQGDRETTAAVKDATGVRVGLWEAGSHVGTELANEPGTPIWNELVSRDLERATQFYADLLGVSWDEVQTPRGSYLVLNAGGRSVGAAVPLPEGPQPPHWNVYFNVTECDAALTRVVELGGSVVVPAYELEGVGRMAFVRDPQGGTFAVLQNPPEA